ncbi:MAG TPA: hypothetical protein VEI07_04365 [Planctomycetaceae bacterium]|nr:hypothetical protein [Planctomycetaceae bacterium]
MSEPKAPHKRKPHPIRMTVFMLLWAFIGMLFPVPAMLFPRHTTSNDVGRLMEQMQWEGALFGAIVGFAIEQLIRIGQRD